MPQGPLVPLPAAARRASPTAKVAPAAPTAADEAVKVDDRFSKWFVIASIAVFVVIFGYAFLFGKSGLLSGVLATPKPEPTPIVTEVPSAPAATPAATEAPSYLHRAEPVPELIPAVG